MADLTNKIDNFIENNLDSALEELTLLVSQPSIAAKNIGLEECAGLVQKLFRKRELEAEVISAGGPAVVFAQSSPRSARTLLIYNHYDVQPPEPLELWDSDPFEPVRRSGKVFGRGISDNKGHLISRLLAVDAINAALGELPCNLKFVVEGEEETGSPHMHDFVRHYKDRLNADACLWESGGVDETDIPQQYLGMRGICYLELHVRTASSDVHSGLGGSIFPNAAWRLSWALSTIKGPDEEVRIPGFYEPVRPPSQADVELMSLQPEVMPAYKTRYGLETFLSAVQDERSLQIQKSLVPACTICGITAGYQDDGAKTVLPATASAKIDFRLVPDQTPEQVVSQLRQHLDAEGFADVEINVLGGVPPGRTDPHHPFVKLVQRSAEPVYGVKPRLIPMQGGSGPIHAFTDLLKLPVTSAGLTYPGTNAHAPNENIRLDLFQKTARHVARIILNFSGMSAD